MSSPDPAHRSADPSASHPQNTAPTPRQIRRWRRYLADEQAEGRLYTALAERKRGEERQILLGLAAAEKRHELHWRELLGPDAERLPAPSAHRVLLGWMARIFGSVFILALAQRAEGGSPYDDDDDATARMAADEAIHEEVVRALATRGREKLSGGFRAAVFGANDGLVSNLALIVGMGGTGVGSGVILLTGIAGLLAGALSMAAGEYVSVRSQRELLDATRPTQVTLRAAPDLDFDHNELILVYRARGMSEADAEHRALERLNVFACDCKPELSHDPEEPADSHAAVGSAWHAAGSSFVFFAVGATIPVLPYLLGAEGALAIIIASALVGVALLGTGAIVGLLSGASPVKRGLRQLGIGLGAAAVTYLLGSLLGVTVA
ncbi:VIT1/CCC1 transporter family protein [Nesterenkonia sp. E16_7]|uniref:VIT1/CCC1 transporter family protein n=1 Tax=unclassified Nesterenkonia TaxID=2629769 RepID=UPI001A9222CF|nr:MULTISPECIES: VIT1/CCC1 family protein [unclassified Nesterenkonia]MBO0594284.1 VIT1/CCC1 transporter family protein [Nesterenkonia sp. E16_10]MBO0597731.1 VIT1/CCC1 transporter family protein [Nesterenkonia sp. E16_7]